MAETITDNEATFKLWLLENVSSAQIGALNLALREIEIQAKKEKLIQTSLYEYMDISSIRKLCESIKRNKIFRYTHKKRWESILSALDYLLKYARSNVKRTDSSRLEQESITEKDSTLKTEKGTIIFRKNSEYEHSKTSKNIDVPEEKKKSMESIQATSKTYAQYNQDDYEAFYRWMLDKQHKAEGTCQGYISSIKTAEKFAKEHHLTSVRLFTDNPYEAKATADALFACPEFVQLNKYRHNNYSAAIAMLLLFYGVGQELSDKKKVSDDKEKVDYHVDADYEAFYRWMLEDQYKAEKTCQGYISSIRTAERFAREHNFTSAKLITDDPDEAKATAVALLAHRDFVQLNKYRHNNYSAAIAMLLSFYAKGGKISDSPTSNSDKGNTKIAKTQKDIKTPHCSELDTFLSGDEFTLLREALASQQITTVEELKSLKLWPFMNRYNIYSIGNRQKIFTKVNAMLFPKTVLSDDQAFVLHVGEDCYKGSTPAETFKQFCDKMLTHYPLQLRLLIGMRTATGSVPIQRIEGENPSLKLTNIPAFVCDNLTTEDVIIYVKWVRSKCYEEPTNVSITAPKSTAIFSEQAKTDNAAKPIPMAPIEPTKAPQEATNKRIGTYVKKLEQIVLSADTQGVSYNDAKDALNTTMVATKRAIAESEHIVDVKGKLIHEDAFIDWEDGADQLESIIEKLMQKNSGYVSASQLYEYAKVEMNMFLTDNDITDERSVFDIATHLFEKKGYHNKHFTFSGKLHISRSDHPVTSNLDIFRNYAADQGGIFSFDSLVEYLQRIGVSTGNLRMQMRIPEEPFFFYYDSGVLMCADNMHIDEEWKNVVKKELTTLLADVGNHIVLRTIPDFWFELLPTLPKGKIWTPLLLQSVLRCYSKDLGAKTIQAMNGQALDTIHTMLVANDSPIQTFGDVVVSYLLDNDIKERSFEAETLRLLLVNAGILQGNELIYNMPKALSNDERFAWNASGDYVIVEV